MYSVARGQEAHPRVAAVPAYSRASPVAATADVATPTPGPGPERSTHPGRMSRPCGARIRIVIGGSQLILLRAEDRPVLSTPHLTPSWSSARARKAQGPLGALDTPTVAERSWAQGPR